MSDKQKLDTIDTIVDFALNHNVDYIYVLQDIMNIIYGKFEIYDWEEAFESYLD